MHKQKHIPFKTHMWSYSLRNVQRKKLILYFLNLLKVQVVGTKMILVSMVTHILLVPDNVEPCPQALA